MSRMDDMIRSVSKTQDIDLRKLCKCRDILERPFEDQILEEYFSLLDYQRGKMRMDIHFERYQGITIDGYEKLRTDVLEAVQNEADTQKASEMIIECGEKLKDAAFYINYHRAVENTCKVFFMIQVCQKMIKAGATLSEILKYVPDTKPRDVYNLAKDYFNIELPLSEDERKLVEEDGK